MAKIAMVVALIESLLVHDHMNYVRVLPRRSTSTARRVQPYEAGLASRWLWHHSRPASYCLRVSRHRAAFSGLPQAS